MNQFQATITQIVSKGSLHAVKFTFGSTPLTMVSLELSDKLKVNTLVNLSVNPNYIALAKEKSPELSYSNQIESTITSIEKGAILSRVELLVNGTNFESIITSESLDRMQLAVGDKVVMLMKASEIYLVD